MSFCSKLRKRSIALLVKEGVVEADNIYDSRISPSPISRNEEIVSVYCLNQNYSGSEVQNTALNFKIAATLRIDLHVTSSADDLLADLIDHRVDQIISTLMQSPDWLAYIEGVSSIEISTKLDDSGSVRVASASIAIEVNGNCTFEPNVKDWFQTASIALDAVDPSDPNRGIAWARWPGRRTGAAIPCRSISLLRAENKAFLLTENGDLITGE